MMVIIDDMDVMIILLLLLLRCIIYYFEVFIIVVHCGVYIRCTVDAPGLSLEGRGEKLPKIFLSLPFFHPQQTKQKIVHSIHQ
jgi:hypothetical protein